MDKNASRLVKTEVSNWGCCIVEESGLVRPHAISHRKFLASMFQDQVGEGQLAGRD